MPSKGEIRSAIKEMAEAASKPWHATLNPAGPRKPAKSSSVKDMVLAELEELGEATPEVLTLAIYGENQRPRHRGIVVSALHSLVEDLKVETRDGLFIPIAAPPRWGGWKDGDGPGVDIWDDDKMPKGHRVLWSVDWRGQNVPAQPSPRGMTKAMIVAELRDLVDRADEEIKRRLGSQSFSDAEVQRQLGSQGGSGARVSEQVGGATTAGKAERLLAQIKREGLGDRDHLINLIDGIRRDYMEYTSVWDPHHKNKGHAQFPRPGFSVATDESRVGRNKTMGFE